MRVIQDESQWFELEPQWDAVLERSTTNSFFLTWPWLRTWWETYRDDYELLVVLAEDDDGLCGIAPFAVTRVGQLEFMGTNAAWGEYLDVIVRRGREQPIAEALADQVVALGQSVWRSVFLRFVRRDAACLPSFRRVFAASEKDLSEVGSDASPYIDLPRSWENYLASHSPNFRSWISRNDNRLAQLGSSRLVFAGQDLGLDEAFNHLAKLHEDRWGKPFEPRFERFHRRVSSALLPLGRLVLVLLEVEGRFVAAKYDFAYGGKIWCYQGGWRRDLKSYRLGNVMLARLLQWAIEHGFKEYDFLAGDVPYKRRWSNACRETVDLGWRPGTL